MLAFEHPDPDWTPSVKWGDAIPALWVRVSPGLWYVWPPQQFQTLEPDGPNIWRTGMGHDSYKPDRPCRTVPVGADPVRREAPKLPAIEWGGALEARWGSFPDGRAAVSFQGFEVEIPPSKVCFSQTHGFANYRLGYFYPSFIWNPPMSPPAAWASCRSGPLASPNANERTWFYPTGDGRRWVATISIEPSEIVILQLPDLLPLQLPTQSEIASEEARIREIFTQGKHDVPEERLVELMLIDLTASSELMFLVGNDAFAAQFHMFVRNHEFVHKPSGKPVYCSSDDDGAWMLSVMRRYGEVWQDCERYPSAVDPSSQSLLERLFRQSGYTLRSYE